MINPKYLITYTFDKNDKLINQINNKFDEINIFIDLKNIYRTLYIKNVSEEICNNIQSKHFIFQGVLYYVVYWKNIFKNKKIRIFFTNDINKSMYHKEVVPEYKSKRCFDNTDFEKIKLENFKLCEEFFKNIKDVWFFNLENIESDFLSYYLIKNKLKFENDNYLNLMCSLDKDLLQCCLLKRTLLFYRNGDYKILINQKNIYKHYFKDKNDQYKNIFDKSDPNNIDIVMSIIGDTIDEIKGVKNIAKKKMLRLLDNKDFIKSVGDKKDIFERINSTSKLLNEVNTNSENLKIILNENKNIADFYKIISFQYLSEYMDLNDTEYKIKINNYIDKILNYDHTTDIEENKKFLNENIDNFKLSESELKILYA